MTQELYRHLQLCLKHEDVARQLTLRDLHLAYEQWACDSLRELTEEMEMWKWDDTLDNKWARVAMCSQMLNIPIYMPEDIKEELRGTSWARATRELRRLLHRIEVVGGSKDQWEAGVWHMDKEQWNLLWTGEQAFWKAVSHLMAAGHRHGNSQMQHNGSSCSEERRCFGRLLEPSETQDMGRSSV
jgi:hypothetical protein